MSKKIKVGITGSIGSGKSTFAGFIAQAGYKVINADLLAKEILSADEKIKKKIISAFGDEAYVDNKLNKKYLAEKVFSNPQNVVKINSIVHPEVKKQIDFLIKEELSKNNFVFVEAALIYEADMEKMFDYVVLITADENIRLKRAAGSKSFDEDDFKKRNENQIKDEEKSKRADFVFVNNSSEEHLKQKAELLLMLLKNL
jgi:dephospho-CoA kinase